MDTPSWADLLVEAFPNLASEGFETVGQASELYNCIAYAAGDTTKWWWPDGINYWPPWASTCWQPAKVAHFETREIVAWLEVW